jgi:hypothetical protein
MFVDLFNFTDITLTRPDLNNLAVIKQFISEIIQFNLWTIS